MPCSKDIINEHAVGSRHCTLLGWFWRWWRPLSGLHKLLLVLLLLWACVVALILFFPPVLEELHPIRQGSVLWEYTNNGWLQDKDSQRVFDLEMSFAAEEPFGLDLYRMDGESFPQDGGKHVAQNSGDGRATIAQYMPRRRILGHNYRLSVSVRVYADVLAVREGQGEWVEHRLFADSERERSFQLVSVGRWDSLPRGRGGDRLLGRDLMVDLLHLVYTDTHPKSGPPEQRDVYIQVQLHSP